MMAQTFSSIIPPSLEMGIAPYKKGTRSNSKLFRGRKALKRPTSPRPLAEAEGNIFGRQSAPSAGIFYWRQRKHMRLKEVEEVKEKATRLNMPEAEWTT